MLLKLVEIIQVLVRDLQVVLDVGGISRAVDELHYDVQVLLKFRIEYCLLSTKEVGQ